MAATESVHSITLSVLSSPPDMVAGPELLLGISGPGLQPKADEVTVNGVPAPTQVRSVTSSGFHALVSGLSLGTDILGLRQTGREVAGTSVTIVDHSLEGPVFSGPYQEPFFCQTEAAGLGSALDANCAAATVVQYFYKSTDPTVCGGPCTLPNVPLPNPCAPYPSGLAMTKTTQGKTVPYLIRVESGTINRAVYRIAILDDPHARGCQNPYTPTAGWNRRLVYQFGGGCGTGHAQGGNAQTGFARVDQVAFTLPTVGEGYADATASLDSGGRSCNDVTAAETMMMVKEHFTEEYGLPVWTLGVGGSGGSILELMSANNYPGLLNGVIAEMMFPDNTSILPTVADCQLMERIFSGNAAEWNQEAIDAVTGFATSSTCSDWATVFSPVLDPVNGPACDAGVPQPDVYNPTTNPGGIRCTFQDNEVNIYGTDPSTGFAPELYDNVGVQYGLKAVMSGKITPQEFVDLNTQIGGLNFNDQWMPQRSAILPSALRTAYASGRVNEAANGLGDIPILSLNYYLDDVPSYDIHDKIETFVLRARLIHAWGSAGNQIIWSVSPEDVVYQPFVAPPMYTAALHTMADWLNRVSADSSTSSLHAKVLRDKPPTASDECIASDGAPPIKEPFVYGQPSACELMYPTHLNPRLVAGEPLTADVLECQLKPFSPTDYTASPISFTPAQVQSLKAAFPSGVCDYSQPGVDQQPAAGTWLSYGHPYGTGAPPPAVPEAPIPALLPLVGLGMLGVLGGLHQRRRMASMPR
ncbi:MAG: DUF6351 family protein [Mycobacteriales bacterium]